MLLTDASCGGSLLPNRFQGTSTPRAGPFSLGPAYFTYPIYSTDPYHLRHLATALEDLADASL
jgi:hypothetical protein